MPQVGASHGEGDLAITLGTVSARVGGMVGAKRLPTHPHYRALALIRDSMPRRDYREYPEGAAEVFRAGARDRALCYAALEEVTDKAVQVAEELDSSDGVVIDLSDDEDAISVVNHLLEIEHALSQLEGPDTDRDS